MVRKIVNSVVVAQRKFTLIFIKCLKYPWNWWTVGRDVIQRMKSKYVSSIDDFYWQKNMRYYWNTDAIEGLGHLTVAMVILFLK